MSFDRPIVIAIYDRLLAAHPDLIRKGKTTAYTALNGNMFSFVGPDGEMCLRLSQDDIAAFGMDWDASPVIRHKSIMNGYVAVSQSLLKVPSPSKTVALHQSIATHLLDSPNADVFLQNHK